MSASAVSVYLALQDDILLEDIRQRLGRASEWAGQVFDPSATPTEIGQCRIVVLDDAASHDWPSQTTVIIVGGDSTEDGAIVVPPDAAAIVEEIHRARHYRELVDLNRASISAPGCTGQMETLAQLLSSRLQQLMRQAEMRIALVDQLPVGVLGIDDDELIVLANGRGQELFGANERPLFGATVGAALGHEVRGFINNRDCGEFRTAIGDRDVIFRKAPFVLEQKVAGTILVCYEPPAAAS